MNTRICFPVGWQLRRDTLYPIQDFASHQVLRQKVVCEMPAPLPASGKVYHAKAQKALRSAREVIGDDAFEESIQRATLHDCPGARRSYRVKLLNFRLREVRSAHVFLKPQYPDLRPQDKPMRWDVTLQAEIGGSGPYRGLQMPMWNEQMYAADRLWDQIETEPFLRIQVKGAYYVDRVEFLLGWIQSEEISLDRRVVTGTLAHAGNFEFGLGAVQIGAENGECYAMWSGLCRGLPDQSFVTARFADIERQMGQEEADEMTALRRTRIGDRIHSKVWGEEPHFRV